MNEGDNKEEKILHIPESKLKEFMDSMQEGIKRRDVERDAIVNAQIAEAKKIQKDPFGLDKYDEGNPNYDDRLSAKIQVKLEDGRVEKKVGSVLEDGRIEKEVGRVLEGPRIGDEVDRILGDGRVETKVDSVLDDGRVGRAVEGKMVAILNEIDGVEPEGGEGKVGLKEYIKGRQDRKHRNRVRTIVLSAIASTLVLGAVGLAAWTKYESSKRTAEGARGVAESAVKGLENYKKEAVQSQKSYDSEIRKAMNESVGAERTDRVAKDGELEKRVEDRLATKVDENKLAAKMADMDKKYADLKAFDLQADGSIKALNAKDESLNQAYESFRAVFDEMTKKLDKSAMKDYTDAEFARIRESVTGLGKRLTDYDGLVKTVEGTGVANSVELKALRETAEKARTDYTSLDKRVRELETYRDEKKD